MISVASTDSRSYIDSHGSYNSNRRIKLNYSGLVSSSLIQGSIYYPLLPHNNEQRPERVLVYAFF